MLKVILNDNILDNNTDLCDISGIAKAQYSNGLEIVSLAVAMTGICEKMFEYNLSCLTFNLRFFGLHF